MRSDQYPNTDVEFAVVVEERALNSLLDDPELYENLPRRRDRLWYQKTLDIFPVVWQNNSLPLVVRFRLDEPNIFLQMFLWYFLLHKLLLLDLLKLLLKILQLCGLFMCLDSMLCSG